MLQARNEAALDRGVRVGEFGATQEMEAARLAQQASQFGLGQELERERLEQQAGQFATTGEQEAARLAQQAELERERLAQQAGQFTTTAEQEAARLLQARNEAALDRGVRIGEFGATTDLQQQALDLQKQQQLTDILQEVGGDVDMGSALGYTGEGEIEGLLEQDLMQQLIALGLQRPNLSNVLVGEPAYKAYKKGKS